MDDNFNFGSEVSLRLKKAGNVISSKASAQRKEKAYSAISLLSISNKLGPSWAAKLIKMFDDLVKE